jgi:hypothetical protein
VISLPSGERIKVKLGGIAPVRMGIGDNGPAIGDTKQVEGRAYRLNRNSRWELVSEDGWGHEGTHTSIADVLNAAKETPSSASGQRVAFHAIHPSEAEAIFKATGLDLSGYAHYLDGSTWNHIVNEHVNEERTGQLKVSEEYLKKLPEIVREFDLVASLGKNQKGFELVRFKKRVMGTCSL